jgi:hypothetical protein
MEYGMYLKYNCTMNIGLHIHLGELIEYSSADIMY